MICIVSDIVMIGCDFGGFIIVIEFMICWVVFLFRIYGKLVCDIEKINLVFGLKLVLK